MVTDSMVKPSDLKKLATLEELEKLSEKVSKLSDKVDKCAKQDDLDQLATEVNRLSKEVEKCAKQEDLDKLTQKVETLSEDFDKLSDKVERLSDKVERLSDKVDKIDKMNDIATKEDIRDLKRYLGSRLSQTNFGMVMAVAFLTIVITFDGTDKMVVKIGQIIMNIISMLT